MIDDRLDATAHAELVSRGDLAEHELVTAAAERVEAANPTLNAVVTSRFEQALDEVKRGLPDGPFRGVPMLVKDYMCQTADDPYYAGMRFLRDRKWVEPNDSHLARRLRSAGFSILGRTNTPELALMGTTEPLAFGATCNPWNLDHSPGGSSGGSAAAVAAGLVPIAHGNDGAGSVRIPASACGLLGLKVSRGRISAGPGPESLGAFAVEGVLARSVRDAARVLDTVAGPMVGDPFPAPPPLHPYAEEVAAPAGRLRVGLQVEAPGDLAVHADCAEAARGAARLLAELGHDVDESGPAALTGSALRDHTRTRSGVNIAAQLDAWSRRTGDVIGEEDVEPGTWLIAEAGRATSGPALASALAELQVIARRIVSWWDGHDLLLTPVTCEPPPPLGEFHDAENPWQGAIRSLPTIAFTQPFNVTGQPAVSVPFHVTADGLPVGVQLVAAPGREDVLLRVASQLEEARPWATHLPRRAV